MNKLALRNDPSCGQANLSSRRLQGGEISRRYARSRMTNLRLSHKVGLKLVPTSVWKFAYTHNERSRVSSPKGLTITETLSATPLLVSLTQGDNSFLNGNSLIPSPFTFHPSPPLTFNLTQNGICVKISAIRQILSNFAKRTKIFFVILHV